jgi:MarR family transcriptional regulator, transcriptional regulator for hemolysin
MVDDPSTTMYETCLLHARADRALRTVVAKQLEGFKVTMMEWLLLGVVHGGPEKGLSMSSIAEALDVTLPQVTALVTNLVKMRLVKQKTQAHDRRSRHVVVTNRGNIMLADMEEAISAVMRIWLEGIPRDQLQRYFDTVRLLANRPLPTSK